MDYKNKVIKIGEHHVLYGLVKDTESFYIGRKWAMNIYFKWSFRPYGLRFSGTCMTTVYDLKTITVSSKEDVINLIKNAL